MDLDVSSYQRDHVRVVVLTGEVDMWTADRFRQALHDAEDADSLIIVVDLTEVAFLDSMGIGVLVGALRRQRERDRQLRLVVANPQILKTFTITRLDHVFPIFDDLIDALAAALQEPA